MIKVNNFIERHITTFFAIFLFVQPILDILTGIMLYHYNVTFTFSSIIRMMFLLFSIYYLVFINKHNEGKLLTIIIAYSILFMLGNILFKNNYNIILELKNLLNNIYLPILMLFVLKLYETKEIKLKNIFIILIIYLLLVFIPNLFNIGFNSYAYSKVGSVGFFYSANAVGSIISILSPIFISYLVKNRKKLWLIIFLIVYIYILFTLGTKAPLLCAAIIFIYYLVLFIVNLIKKKKYVYIIILFISLIIFILLLIKIIPLTPFYRNLIIHLKFLKINNIPDLFTFKNIDHFIFSSRLSFFKNSINIYTNSSIYQKLFGIGYTLNNNQIKLVEMDYLDTFIHQGILGFIVIYYTYFKSIFNIIKSYSKNIKINFIDIEKSSMIISILISILCALLTGHVLSTPAVSVFVIVVLVISHKNICNKE